MRIQHHWSSDENLLFFMSHQLRISLFFPHFVGRKPHSMNMFLTLEERSYLITPDSLIGYMLIWIDFDFNLD